MSKVIILCLFLLSSVLNAYEYKLSIAAITKGEEFYLKEWISYHLLMGVDHFYLYDNNKGKKTKRTLQNYIDKGIVELIPWPDKWPEKRFFEGCQVYAYQNALKKAAHRTKWLAIIDTDEFIVPVKHRNILKVINKHYKSHGFIFVNWRVFGTSNVFLEPGVDLLPRLVKCSKLSDNVNKWGKTICRPELALTVKDVHFVRTKYPYLNGSGTFRVNDSHQSDLLILNHYMLRDENFLRNIKIPRQKKMWKFKKTEEQLLEDFHRLNETFCIEENYRIIELLNAHKNYN